MRLTGRSDPAVGVAPADGVVEWDAWSAGWCGALALAFANAALRQRYARVIGEAAAERVSDVTLLLLVLPWATHVERRHPLEGAGDAMRVGLAWAGATVSFELGFGHYVAGDSWADLRGAYDLRAGRLWPLDVVGVALAPAAARRWNLLATGG